MSEATADKMEPAAATGEVAQAVASCDGNTVRLAAGIAPVDLTVAHSYDGQYLLIHCGDEFVAVYGSAGGSPAAVEFADGGRYSIEELLDLVAGV
jgi:hypothetical protein